MKKPLIVEYEDAPASPADAPAVVDLPDPATATPEQLQGRAMQIALRLAARPGSPLGRFFLWAAGALVGFIASVMAWQFVAGLMARYPVLGWVATVLFGLFALAALLLAGRELAAFARLSRIDAVQQDAGAVLQSHDLTQARRVSARVAALYAGRREMAWGLDRLKDRGPDELDATTLMILTETELMTPLDGAARLEVEAAVRTVATVTALVPLALADVLTALSANLRMIRRIGEIYGGRAGVFGSLRLARTVMTHLVATGAVAAGDDLIETVTGGHLVTKLSRRFGEGVVNGALTARVGIAAMEVCRPMPFNALRKPRVTHLTGRALAGVFSTAKRTDTNEDDVPPETRQP